LIESDESFFTILLAANGHEANNDWVRHDLDAASAKLHYERHAVNFVVKVIITASAAL